MSFPIPSFTRGQITRAGRILVDESAAELTKLNALAIVNNWRACHAYPVNTFQATLRKRAAKVCENPLIATRLKRVPSITKKLSINDGMQLARMQDIGGLRAVVDNIQQVRKIEEMYKQSKSSHELIDCDDYISNPKDSGYRSLHLIYRYRNNQAPSYNGLCLELQIRTKLQHAWATSVETIGSFLNQALKSNEGPAEWLDYFKLVSGAFSLIERCPVHSDLQKLSPKEIFVNCVETGKKLDVRRKLSAFSVAAKAITSQPASGSYHLIVLDAVERTVSINSYGKKRLDAANNDYAEAEKKALGHPDMQTVLVTTNSVQALRRAYPNYFLDTKQFLAALQRIERAVT